jgi:hypothetical protein
MLTPPTGITGYRETSNTAVNVPSQQVVPLKGTGIFFANGDLL